MSDPPVAHRRIIANFDCEVDYARFDVASRRERGEKTPTPDDPRFALPLRVLRAISASATLLRVFAWSNDDCLWTPLPVSDSRMADLHILPLPRLESGRLKDLPPADRLLAWGETEAVSASRRAEGGASRSPPDRRAPRGLAERLWDIEPSSPAGAMRANHRGFCLETAREMGVALPGARLLGSLAELEDHLRLGGARADRRESWVLKAHYSAAGRTRVFGRGARVGDAARRRQLERLFALYGSLLFEPWLERLEDFGACALVSGDSVRPLGTHRLTVDGLGRFRAVTLRVGSTRAPELYEMERKLAGEALQAAGERARSCGYRGALGIDCWRYRDRSGNTRFHPIGEINARMTIGLVARALVERLAAASLAEEGAVVSLRLGSANEMASAPSPPKRIIQLLHGGKQDDMSAWLEVATSERN